MSPQGCCPVCAPSTACGCEQAEDRAHRIGQKKEVVVLVLVSANTIEQVILDRAQQKKEIDAKVIQVSCSTSPWCLCSLMLCQVQKRKEKKRPRLSASNSMRSQVLYQAAQGFVPSVQAMAV